MRGRPTRAGEGRSPQGTRRRRSDALAGRPEPAGRAVARREPSIIVVWGGKATGGVPAKMRERHPRPACRSLRPDRSSSRTRPRVQEQTHAFCRPFALPPVTKTTRSDSRRASPTLPKSPMTICPWCDRRRRWLPADLWRAHPLELGRSLDCARPRIRFSSSRPIILPAASPLRSASRRGRHRDRRLEWDGPAPP